MRLTETETGKLAASQMKREGSPCLRRLDIGGCARITDKGLKAIGSAKHLEYLDLRGLEKTTAHGLMGLLAGLEGLREVNIMACTGDPAGIRALVEEQVAASRPPSCSLMVKGQASAG